MHGLIYDLLHADSLKKNNYLSQYLINVILKFNKVLISNILVTWFYITRKTFLEYVTENYIYTIPFQSYFYEYYEQPYITDTPVLSLPPTQNLRFSFVGEVLKDSTIILFLNLTE